MFSTLLSTKKVKDSSYRLRPSEFVRFRTETIWNSSRLPLGPSRLIYRILVQLERPDQVKKLRECVWVVFINISNFGITIS
jgi:hypothetical protein